MLLYRKLLCSLKVIVRAVLVSLEYVHCVYLLHYNTKLYSTTWLNFNDLLAPKTLSVTYFTYPVWHYYWPVDKWVQLRPIDHNQD